MAYRIKTEGIEELIKQLGQLGDGAEMIAARALYEGAAVVADAVSRSVQGITTEPFKYAKNGNKRKPSPEEKAAIQGAPHGVAKFRKKLGAVDTSVGWNSAGYVDVNFNHMKGSARTNYKAYAWKNHESTASSTLQFINYNTGQKLGKGAQNQKPIGAIAGAINHGTSFMEKQPFIRKAFSQSRNKAIAVIEEEIMKQIEQQKIG